VYRLLADTTKRQEIPVPLNRILQRKSPDFTLVANDILYIPDNAGKRLSANVVEKITGVAGATVSGIIIWGR
jgi:polysaccharide export outer membrane protein